MLAKTKTYTALVNDIAELYTQARQRLVESYWQIGKMIVEQEQQGQAKAQYGVRLLEHLAEDLQEKLGSGFSIRNLRNMRRFYLNNPIRQTSAELDWSQHVELLPVVNKADRKQLEQYIVRDNLSPRQIRDKVKQLNAKNKTVSSNKNKTRIVLPQPCRRNRLQCYSLIDSDKATCFGGGVMVDFGFDIWCEIDRKDAESYGKPSYTYPAKIESVIDGDTLWVIVDCAYGIFTRQKIRLQYIDTPERGTPQGEKATRFVKRVLKKNSEIVICTHHYDKYERYLADVFYLSGSTEHEEIYAQGIYLNQQL